MVVLMWRASFVNRRRSVATPYSAGFILGALVFALAAAIVAGQTPERRVIRVSAERFAFSPSEVMLDEGEEVEFRLRSDDTAHGFRILDTDVKAVLPKRGKGEVSVIFKAERAGRYTFECHRMCGAGHDFMRGAINVRPRETVREP